MAMISALASYPVKGCAAVPATAVDLTPAGPEHDRSFLVIDEDGVFRSQRRTPALAAVRPEVAPDGSRLTLRAPGHGACAVDVDLDRERRGVVFFGAPLRGIDQGDTVAAWLSEVLGVPSRLVRVPPEQRRETTGATPGTAAYADGNAVLLVGRASLDGLNARIAAGGGAPVPMARFRPNIVVDGWPPHAEDRVRALRVGSAELGFAKLAVRCAVTLVDQDTGARSGPEPLRTLARYRRAPEGGVVFGMKASVVRPGRVSVGDEVEVTTWSPAPR
ncbi:MOSC domain-containing protein [Nocardiopsis trehalosi]|jgi:uncharacterized protein YcbX|uniref:MOSC domain-containing protein n=1 Tax=Nocardiopsis trehalosi TaxID=109329 RepID=UPI000833FAD4|nr:MOSC N-terminal beta barrel domain-containing protein [Nocardiopsis trehalosi]